MPNGGSGMPMGGRQPIGGTASGFITIETNAGMSRALTTPSAFMSASTWCVGSVSTPVAAATKKEMSRPLMTPSPLTSPIPANRDCGSAIDVRIAITP